MIEQVTFVVTPLDISENKACVVYADIIDLRNPDDNIGTESFLKDAISKAVTRWVLNSESGKQAYIESKNGKLTLESLSNYLQDVNLGIYLATFGVLQLYIDVIEPLSGGYWHLDDSLFIEE